ncbi:MAG: AAA family ATPase [Bacteroidia bacterium]
MGSDTSKYKFKELKVYSSTEWLADGQKKYRRVFDQNEITYMYSEFSFFNKQFDEEDWDAKIVLKAFSTTKPRKEICSIDASRKISKDQNIIFIREGWGMDEVGSFWKEGTYCWEAYIDEAFVASQTFYIYDVGIVTQTDNKYLTIQSVKLYEGPDKGTPPHERVYCTQFNAKDARYVWGEFTAQNKANRPWMCEIFYYFYNDARQLKGRTSELIHIEEGKDTFTITSGWGSDHKGTWFLDNYTLEIVFMDTLIGIVSFTTGSENVEGDPLLLKPTESAVVNMSVFPTAEPTEPQNLEEALTELNELIGLEPIKDKIREYAQYLNFLKVRKEKGLDDLQAISLHAVFTGNPGTGKTTVARLLGQIYKRLGLLTKGHVHEVDRADLVGEYIGQTAPKVKEAIKKARGGILFIDEAYSLARAGEDSKDYGKEVLEILIKEMSDGKGDLAVIVAGYPREMNTFLQSNPGLKSRFNIRYDFPDYTPQELYAIAELAAKKRGITFGEGVDTMLYQKLVNAFRGRDRSFGNARYVFSLIDEAKMEMGLRMMRSPDLAALTKEDISTVSAEDVQKVFIASAGKRPHIPEDAGLLQEALEELKGMTGLSNVKLEVNELVKLVRFYQDTGKDVMNKFSLHSVFMGNPGTGKTTVARIMGKILKALGVLERGELIEVDKAALVAGYTGQTAIKTDEIIEKAKGSVLFIDEAYSLSSGHQGDFGHEAIEILLKRMEDLRGEFVVVVAGYPDRMKEFLESNPGLKSRFDRKFDFQDYNANELMEIALHLLKEEGLEPDDDAKEHLLTYFKHLHAERNKYFGNGRAVRKVVEKAIRNQHLRLANLTKEERTIQMLNQLTVDDVKEFDKNSDILLEGGAQGRIRFA